ncbi:MAG: hypothetical protein HN805_09115 [Rhodobacteraceae bacterium]|nr:hypothetical protein [Paracoccaceae bacterium]
MEVTFKSGLLDRVALRVGIHPSFVIFGKGTGFAADILVNALDGADGFRADHSGLVGAGSSGVAGVGDINGDSLDDLAAGLPPPLIRGWQPDQLT